MKHLFKYLVISVFLYSCERTVDYVDFISETDSNFGTLFLNKTRTVVLETNTNSSIGAPLYRVEFNSRGDMYFFDSIKNNFLVYTNDGEFLKSFGRTGRGPLEFQLVYAYNIDAEDNLYVYDDAQRQIKVFNNDLQLTSIQDVDNAEYFISSHSIEIINDEVILGVIDARVVGNGMNRNELINSSPIMIVSSDSLNMARYLGTYDPYIKSINSRYNRPLFDIDEVNNTILVSHQNSYRFQEYDMKSGERVTYFGVKDESFGEGMAKIRQGENRQSRISKTMSESSNEKVFYTSDYIGNYYINGTEQWFDTKDLADLNYFISLYSKDNHSLKSVLRTDYRLIGVFNDELYFIEDENPDNFQIGIYSIAKSR